MADSPLDSFLYTPGAGGDAARDDAANPPLPGEMPSDTSTRVLTTQRIQQQVQGEVNRTKGRDLAARSIPSYNDPSGNVQAVTGADGSPITHYDKGSNVGYDGTGNPVQLSYNSESGAPAVEDAYKGVPVTTDPKTGNQYKIRDGLPWQSVGVDPTVAAANLEQEKQKAVSQASTALGRKLTLDERQLHRDTVDFNTNKKALTASVPSLQGQDDADPATLHNLVDQHFNSLYAAPEANETAGWFGSGGLSPQATVLRQQLDQQKATAHQQVDGLADLKTSIEARAQHIDQQNALQQQLLQTTVDSKLGKLSELGAMPPQPGQVDAGAHNPGVGDSSSQPAAVAPSTDQLATAHQAIQDAQDGKKPYQYDPQTGIHFQPENIADGLKQAVSDNLIDPKWAADHQDDFQKAQDEYKKLEDQAGGAQVLKALLRGGGTGAAFWGGSIPGAKGGAMLGAAIPGLGETGLPEIVGGVLGGLATGSLAKFAANKMLDQVGKYSETIQSLNASAQLHPVANEIGNIAGMSLNAPKALSNVYNVVKMAGTGAREAALLTGATAQDAAAAAQTSAFKMAAKIVGAAGATGAVFEGAVRPLFDLATNTVADVLGIKHDDVQAPAVKSMAINVGLAIATAGHNIEFKDYSANDIGSIFTRAQMRQMAGVPLDAQLDPAKAAEVASKIGLNSDQVQAASQPLSKSEIGVFNSIGDKVAAMKATGKYDDATINSISAKQAIIPEFGKKDGTPLTTTSIETEPGKPGGGAQAPPQVGAPPEKPVSGKVVEPETTPSVETGKSAPAPESTAEQAPGAAAGGAVTTVDTAAHEAATSPSNSLATPTDSQKEAGNYQKGHVNIGGLDISIENPAGSSRRPEWPPLTAHYGYVKGTEGNDGDHIDTFIKPGTPTDYNGPVFVVNQQNKDGSFDEHKSVIGVNTPEEARALYASNYSKVPGIHSIASFPDIASFKDWAHATRAPKETAVAGAGAATGGNPAPAPEAAPVPAEPKAPEPAPVTKPAPEAVDTVRKTANAALKLHADELKALGHPVAFGEGPVRVGSGIATDTATHRILLDPEKMATATANMDKAKAAEWIKRVVAHEVIHVGTLKYAAESPTNMAKLMALNGDKELMDRAASVYGPEWPKEPFARAAEAARMLIEGPENLTEASYSFLQDFLKWLREKLGNLSKDVKDVIRGIEEKMGRYKATEPTKENAPPKEDKLPAPLSGAKPRYSFGSKQFELNFASDVDRAAYITAQEKPSKRDAEYLAFAQKATGMSGDQVRAHGLAVRAAIKTMARDAEPGTLQVTKQQVSPAQKPAPQGSAQVKLTPKEQAAKDAAGELFGAARPFEREGDTAHPVPYSKQDARRIRDLADTISSPENDHLAELKTTAAEAKDWRNEPNATAQARMRDRETLALSELSEAIERNLRAEKAAGQTRDNGLLDYITKVRSENPSNPDRGDYLAGATPETFDGKIPPEKRNAMTMAFLDLSSEANTPEKFAAALLKLGPKAPQFSQQLWFIAKGGDAEGPDRPDWASIYGKLSGYESPSLYHETPHKFSPSDFKPFSHFGSEESAAAVWDNWKSETNPEATELYKHEVKLGIKNPIRIEESDSTTTPELWANALADALKKKGFANSFNYGHGGVPERRWSELFAEAKSAGYDGIVYKNEGEGGGDSYIPFDNSQITHVKTTTKKLPENPQRDAQKDKTALTLAGLVSKALRGGPIDRHGLGKLAKDHPGLSIKEIDEAAELGVVMRAREIAKASYGTPAERFDAMSELYQWQPNLTAKTSTSKINQAYSTPVPLAFVGSQIAGTDSDGPTQESTAGNGALLMEDNPKTALVNELDPTRAANLRAQGFTVSSEDATKWTPPVRAARVKINPPFGTVKGEDGNNLTWTVDGFKTDQIDHAIALQSLLNMKDDGRAVMIIGGSQAVDRDARRGYYALGNRGEFFKKLYAEYGVIDHFTVNGDLYRKQGAGWPVDVIVIAGRKPSPIQLPNVNPPRILNSWDELKSELSKTDEDRIKAGQYDEGKDRGELGDALAGIRSALDAGKGTGKSGDESQSPAKSNSAGGAGELTSPDGVESNADSDGAILPTAGEGESGVGDGSLEHSGDGKRGLTDGQDKSDETKQKFHEKYVPVSKGPSFDIETPANIAGPQREALERIEREVGKPLAEFVRDELGYGKNVDMGEYFAAEQMDAAASAIYQLRNNGALILGDMTGVGKGRVVAGLMEWAKQNGIIPVFVTKNDTLYSAMLGDFHDIDKQINPLYTKNNLDILHPVTEEPIKTKNMDSVMERMAKDGKLPEGMDSVFTTYDQIGKDYDPSETANDRKGLLGTGRLPMPGKRTLALNKLVSTNKTLILLDESHLGAGDSIQGKRILQLLNHKGTQAYYSSATYAKRPDAMPLYFKTNLRLAADSPEQLQEVFRNGGAVMQTVASRMLAADGQYMRRERTYDGIPFQTHINLDTEERDTRLGDEYTSGLRRLLDMSNKVKAATASLNKIMARQGKKMEVPVIKMESADFASQIHNFVAQYLFAIKTEAAINQAINAIKTGHPMDPEHPDVLTPHKVVITVQNTMESPLKKLMDEGRPLEFNSMLKSTLDGLRRIKIRGSEGRGTAEYFHISRQPAEEFKNSSDDELISNLVKVVTTMGPTGPTSVGVVNDKVAMELFRRMANPEFLAAEEHIGGLDLGNMPLSPIDAIRQRLEQEGIKTGEITGRSMGLDAEGKAYDRPKSDYSKRGQLKAMNDFNNTDLDALVLNASGSTGISLHAGKNFKNKKPRMMIVLQPHLDINEFMQTLGRILRSGQVHKPRYMLLQTSLPAELRPAAIMGQKMALLNANTTSNVDSQVSEGAKITDIFNEYGDGVVWRYLADNPRFTADLQYKKIMDAGILMPLADIMDMLDEDGKLARNVSSYAGIMPIEDQKQFWDEVTNRYTALISYLDQLGENKLKASASDIGAETVDSKPFTAGRPGGKSAFDAPSSLETVSVKPKTKPLEPEDVLAKASEARKTVPKLLEDYKKQRDAFISQYLTKLKERTAPDLYLDKMAKERARLMEQYNEVWAQINRIGNTVSINTQGGKKVGAIVGVEIDPEFPLTPSKQVFEVLNNSLKRTFKIPGSQLQQRVTEMPRDGFEVLYNASREDKQQRHVITGNLVAASAKLGGAGQVTLYTKSDGTVGTGILLPGGFDPNAVNRVNIKDVADALRALRSGATLSGDSEKVKVTANVGKYYLEVPSSKSGGGKYWQDRALNAAMIGGQFRQQGALMKGEISDLGDVIGTLDRLGATLGYTPPKGGQLGAADPHKIKIGDRVMVYKKEGTIVSIKGKKLTVNLDEGGVIGAHTDNVTPIPAETPESKAARAASEAKGVPATTGEKVSKFTDSLKNSASTSLQTLIDRVKTFGGSAKDFFTGLKTITDYWRAKGEWLGTGDIGDPRSTGRQASDFRVREMLRGIDKKFSGPAQEAVTNFVQADGNRAELERRAAASRPLFKKGYERAANLTPDEMELVSLVRNFFADFAKKAHEAGLLREFLENYINQMWKRRNDNSAAANAARDRNLAAVGPGRLNTTFENAFERIHESYFAGEQKGLIPFTKEVGKLMAVYAESFNRVVENRAFIKKMAHEIDAADGRPATVISGYGKEVGTTDADHALLIKPRGKPNDAQDYELVDNSALRGWRHIHTDENGNSTYLEGDMLVHPEFAADLRRTLGESAIARWPVIKQARSIQHFIKNTLLSLSGFHFVTVGVSAIGHGINPFHLEKVDPTNPRHRELLNYGLMAVSNEARRSFSEGLAGGGLIDKLPIIGPFNQAVTSALFEDIIPAMKMTAGLAEFDRVLHRFSSEIQSGKVSREQLGWKVAKDMNDTFGEQHWRLMGASQTMKDIMGLAFLAPDFSFSRGSAVADAFTKYGGVQRRAILLLAAGLFAMAKIAEKALTGENDWKHPFSVTYKGRRYALRSIPGDIIDLFADTRRFIFGRMSPLVSRTLIESITGRDWRGQQRSIGEQLEDLIKTPIPIAIRGLIDNRVDITKGEQLTSSLGVQIKRQSDIADIRNAGRDWQTSRGKPEDKTTYPPSKYLPLKYALEDGDESKARSAFRDIAKVEGSAAVVKGVTKSLSLAFSGKASDEADFLKSLSPSQRATYNRADMKRTQMLAMLQRISASTPVAPGPATAAHTSSRPTHNAALMFKGFH